MNKMTKALYSWLAALTLVAGAATAHAEDIKSPLPPNAGVARAAFTTQVIDQEPADQVVVLTNNINEITYFTDIRGMAGRTVTFQWEHEGRVISRISFDVEGARAKLHSNRQLDPALTGKWSVLVVDEKTGWPIHASTFRYDPVAP